MPVLMSLGSLNDLSRLNETELEEQIMLFDGAPVPQESALYGVSSAELMGLEEAFGALLRAGTSYASKTVTAPAPRQIAVVPSILKDSVRPPVRPPKPTLIKTAPARPALIKTPPRRTPAQARDLKKTLDPKLKKIVSQRDKAVCSSRSERARATRMAISLGDQVQRLGRDIAAARRAGNAAKVKQLEAQAVSLTIQSLTMAGRALNYAKTEAVGAALKANAESQRYLLRLWELAKVKGLEREARVLSSAYQQIGQKTAAIKSLRERQVQKWEGETAAAKVLLSKSLVAAEKAKAEQIVDQAVRSGVPAQNIQAMLEKQQAKISDIEDRAQAAKVNAVQRCNQRSLSVATQSLCEFGYAAVVNEMMVEMREAGLGGFGDLGAWYNPVDWVKGAGGAIQTAAGATASATGGIGQKIGSGIKKVGSAGKDLLQGTACAITSQDEVCAAAVTAGGASAGVPPQVGLGVSGGICGALGNVAGCNKGSGDIVPYAGGAGGGGGIPGWVWPAAGIGLVVLVGAVFITKG